MPGARADEGPLPGAAIIGAGIAGAALARALLAEGVRPVVIDPAAGDAASGNPAALVTPALDAGGGPRARFYAQAFGRAVDLYGALGPEGVIGRGVLQLARSERDPHRFRAVMDSGLFADGALTLTDAGLRFEEGLILRPEAVTRAWLEAADRIAGRVQRLEGAGAGWRIHLEDGRSIEAERVFVAAGAGALLEDASMFTPVRGQASWAKDLQLEQAMAWGGYAVPMDGGVLFGATHDRGRTDTEVLAEDHARNLLTLRQALPGLAEQASLSALHGRAAIRATTFDRLPAAGALAPGLYLLGGLGSRGFCTAPLLADHLAALALGSASPLPLELQDLIVTGRLQKKRSAPTAC